MKNGNISMCKYVLMRQKHTKGTNPRHDSHNSFNKSLSTRFKSCYDLIYHCMADCTITSKMKKLKGEFRKFECTFRHVLRDRSG